MRSYNRSKVHQSCKKMEKKWDGITGSYTVPIAVTTNYHQVALQY